MSKIGALTPTAAAEEGAAAGAGAVGRAVEGHEALDKREKSKVARKRRDK